MIEGYKLSPIQKDLWLQAATHPGLPARTETTIEIEGSLDPERLAQALRALTATHEIFATRFRGVGGMVIPLQVIEEPGLDWSVRHPREDEPIGTLPIADPFDPGKGPLIRATLYVHTSERHTLHVALPSLLADAGTLGLLPGMIAALYDDPTVVEDEERATYAAVGQWLQEILDSEDAEEGKAHWNKVDVAQKLAFGLEKPADGKTFVAAESASIQLEGLGSIEALARDRETSVQALCFATWAVLAHRLSGDATPVIATAFDGRADEDLVEIPGPLDRVLPVSIGLRSRGSFEDALEDVGTAVEEAFAWQECFAREDGDYASLAFSYRERPTPVQLGGPRFVQTASYVCDTAYGLKLCLVECAEGLRASIRFDAARYRDDMVGLILARFQTMLAAVGEAPRTALAALPVLSENERDRLLCEVHGTKTEVDHGCDVYRRFRRQARETPERIAVVHDGREMTYAELAAHTDRIAARFRALGAGPESYIAIAAEREPVLPAAVMATFAIGAIYQPLDPDYPEALLAYELAVTRPAVLVTQSATRARLPDHDGAVLLLDEVEALPEAEVTASAMTCPEQAAYIIFTSGSTGRPKGVLVSHRALLEQVLAVIDHHQLTERDRFLQFSSLNFDASIEQLIPPLMCGAATVLRGSESWEGEGIDGLIDGMDLTIVNFPTAYFHLLARQWAQGESVLPNGKLRLVVVGGERLLDEYVDLWQRSALGEIPLVNAYGPTEATVSATMEDLPSDYTHTRQTAHPPIGRPLTNRRIYVLDGDMTPVPIGVDGRLFLGGAGVARGYHGAPGQTAAVFVPDPFGETGQRLYDSGDRARFAPDGRLQFEGRRDHQIKIRGYRIELGEIEKVLAAHGAVEEAVVIVHEVAGAPESTRLIGYYIATEGHDVEDGELRDHLTERLPGHMIPTALVEMKRWPLLPNGKVDRKSLPDPEAGGARVIVPPRSPAEHLLAQLWCGLLGLSEVSITDNFFELGGHSLLTTQLVSRIRQLFGIDVDLLSFFTIPDLASQARVIEERRQQGAGIEIPPLEPVAGDGPFPASYSQQRLWFVYQVDGANPAYHNAAAFTLSGALNVAALEATMAEIVARHATLRTTFHTEDGAVMQTIHPDEGWTLPIFDLSGLDDELQRGILADAAERGVAAPFDLEHGPMLRFQLFRLSSGEHAVTCQMHHIVSDGWSQGIFVRELVALYAAHARRKPSPLPELPVRFADYAVWQRSWLSGEVFERELAYWAEHLRDAPLTTPLPYDHPRPEQPGERAEQRIVSFPESLTASVHQLCRDEDVTLFMALSAAFSATLFHLSGERDILVGTDSANRNRYETEHLIGFFINQLVLRTDLDGNPSLRELLAQTRTTALNAFLHGEMPFDRLVESLEPERGAGRHPFFQVKLVLQNAPTHTLDLPGISLTPMASTAGTTKLDLQLNIWERDDALHGQLLYKTELFEADTMAAFCRHFERALEQLTGDLDQSLEAFSSALGEAEETYRSERSRDLKQSRFDKFKSLIQKENV